MPARTARPKLQALPGSKHGFAKRALRFANRVAAGRELPGFPMLEIGCLGAAGLMVVTGGFGTGDLPLAERALFWLLLMGWNAIKWQAWFAVTVRRPTDWPRASLIGTLLLNLPLPVEIALCGAAVGRPMHAAPVETWSRAFALSGVIIVVASLIAWVLLRKPVTEPGAAAADGLLSRARIAPEAVACVEAEDHYCRVRTLDGRNVLLHYRFGDALAELAALDGLRVHRGTWVAAAAVDGVDREGRRWRLRLRDGRRATVSATYVADARARGWINRRGVCARAEL
jgi:hypothetical protein